MADVIVEKTGAVAEPPPSAEDRADLRRRTTFIGAGIVLVVFGYPDTGIGDLPLRYVLSNQLGVAPAAMALWFALANIPSWCKPVIGILSDSIPLLGTRRRHYLMFAASLAAIVWLQMILVPPTYHALLWTAISLNALCTVCGTVHGGVVMEEGKKRGMTGRLASLRSICSNMGAMAAGPLGGFLATLAFGWTALTGAILMASLAVLGYFCLREPRTATRNRDAWPNAKAQLSLLGHSKPLWIAGILMFLLRIAPGFSTPLFYHQDEVLLFSKQFVGTLAGLASAAAFLGGFLYYVLCRKFALRHLLWICVLADIVTTLGFLVYDSASAAIVIRTLSGMGNTLSFLALFDLTARATPKGSEAMGYSVMYAFINVALSGSDYLGAHLYQMFGNTFGPMVLINAATTALILLVLPRLPDTLVRGRDGDARAT